MVLSFVNQTVVEADRNKDMNQALSCGGTKTTWLHDAVLIA